MFVFCRMEKPGDSLETYGLNSMKYTVNKITEHVLYTQVTADVKDAMLHQVKSSIFVIFELVWNLWFWAGVPGPPTFEKSVQMLGFSCILPTNSLR